MTLPGSSPSGRSGRDGVNLRLLWPQWRGAGTSSVRELASEFPSDVARRGYAVGSAVLEAVLPPHDGPTVTVPVAMSDDGLAERDGVEAKTVILDQLARALEVIGQHDPAPDLRALMTGLLGVAYGTTQASYDLARLARNGLITRRPHANTYDLTPDGLKFAIFYTKVHDRVLAPLFTAGQPPAPPQLHAALTAIQHHIDDRLASARLPMAA